MHVTGDSINSYITEVHPEHRLRVPDDVYELVYFLDEDLSHLLLFGAIFSLFGFWTYESNIKIQTGPSASFLEGRWPSVIAGAAHGFTCTFASYETGHPALGLFSIGWNLFNWWRKSYNSREGSTTKNVMVSFVISYCCVLSIGLVLYFILMGGFVQPSEIGGFFGVIRRAGTRMGFSFKVHDALF